MQTRSILTVAILLRAALMVVCSCESPSPRPASVQQATAEKEPPGLQEYFAQYTGPCGMTLLDISTSEAGPFESVVDVGPQAPNEKLREHVWEFNRFIVRGRFTGKERRGITCKVYREFEVLSFRPWGSIRRCVSLGDTRAGLQLYGEELPKDRYAPEDFLGGPELPMVDDEHCRKVEVCAEDEKRITSCRGGQYCCRLRPMSDE
jgi:hypothetical protein